ncbi:MAG: twin-arginine translocase subunit TatC [Bacteroidales bacterium]|nr:twin-arginine translocase subunit TatC [Bacteroidales bacterium]
MESEDRTQALTFWEHLEELRRVLFRMVAVAVAGMLVAFAFKEPLFEVVMAPHRPDFWLYRGLRWLAVTTGMDALDPGDFHVKLINTQLAGQFVTHMSVSLYAGIVLVSPYLLYALFGFIAPGLYTRERRYAVRVLSAGYLLFLTGVLLNYFLLYPLTFRFLALYQVSEEVVNTITLTSYVDTLAMMSLLMGIVFEIPVVCWLLGKLGWLNAARMRAWRKQVVVALLVVAAVITPTSDVFTLLMVACPMWLLYEASIWMVRK